MNSATFSLERRKDKQGKPVIKNFRIRLSFFFNNNRLEYYTQVSIRNKNNFNKDYRKTGKSPIKANEPEAARKNKWLNDMKIKVEQLYDNAIALETTPTVEYLRGKLNEHFKGKKIEEPRKFVSNAYEEFLIESKVKKSHLTWQKINTTKEHLKAAFSDRYYKLTFSAIDATMEEKFRLHLVNAGYLNNTVIKYRKTFRAFLNWCKDDKRKYFTGNIKFDDLTENDISVVYLNEKQITKLENAKMPNDSLKKVKDVFLFCCYTGLRYGDVFNLKKVNVLKDAIRFYVIKNKNTVWHEVPLVSQAQAILNLYKNIGGDKALPVISNPKMNLFIKDVMKEAKFDEPITLGRKLGDGSIKEETKQFWQAVGVHTARKTFISLAVEKGMPEMVIKSISAHSPNSRAFTKYFKVSKENKSKELSKVFGQKSTKLKAV